MEQLSGAFQYLFTGQPFLVLLAGVSAGIIFGAAPGLTGVMAMALMLPITLFMDREIALKRWALLLEKLLGRVPLAWVFANNHFAGHAPATIRTLAEMVGRE